MDNAAKALLMAGGILLAILTLSLLVIMFGNINLMAVTKEKETEAKKLQEWNAEWESYNKSVMYGYELVTVINKAAENNSKYMEQPQYQIDVQVEGIDIDTELSQHKMSIFKCDKIGYNDDTGRVNSMKYVMIKE